MNDVPELLQKDLDKMALEWRGSVDAQQRLIWYTDELLSGTVSLTVPSIIDLKRKYSLLKVDNPYDSFFRCTRGSSVGDRIRLGTLMIYTEYTTPVERVYIEIVDMSGMLYYRGRVYDGRTRTDVKEYLDRFYDMDVYVFFRSNIFQYVPTTPSKLKRTPTVPTYYLKLIFGDTLVDEHMIPFRCIVPYDDRVKKLLVTIESWTSQIMLEPDYTLVRNGQHLYR